MTDSAAGVPKHRSERRRWWPREPKPAGVPDPVWVPGWASDWTVVEPQPGSVPEQRAASED